MTDCLFCKISSGEMDTEFVYEDDEIVVFPDLYPKADTHLLVVPKLHIESLKDLTLEHSALITNIILTLTKLATERDISGYRTIINTGSEGGQEIDHLHFHFLHGNLPTFGKG